MSCASSWNTKARAYATGSAGPASPFWPNRATSEGVCSGAPRWLLGPFGVAAMVVGFIVFWPIGLAILGLNIWHRRGAYWGFAMPSAPHAMWSRPGTGNAMFEDWRQSEIERIEKERQKLAEAEREFVAFLDELKRAKDREEFERFMQARQNWSADQAKPADRAP